MHFYFWDNTTSINKIAWKLELKSIKLNANSQQISNYERTYTDRNLECKTQATSLFLEATH